MIGEWKPYIYSNHWSLLRIGVDLMQLIMLCDFGFPWFLMPTRLFNVAPSKYARTQHKRLDVYSAVGQYDTGASKTPIRRCKN